MSQQGSRTFSFSTRERIGAAIFLLCGLFVHTIEGAMADPVSCTSPVVQERLRQQADTEINRSFRNDPRGERAQLFPEDKYDLVLTVEDVSQAGSYRTCKGTLAITAKGGQQATVNFSFNLERNASSGNGVMWAYAPFHIANLLGKLRTETKLAADKRASRQALDDYDQTRSKGAPFCPAWLDETDKRERAKRTAYFIAQSLRNPREPQAALKNAQSTLAMVLGLPGDRRQEAMKMTESDFVSCIPEIGKLLVENERRYVDDIRQRKLATEPPSRLLDAYKNYIAVKQCAESRASYEIKYIQDSELEEAKEISKLIEEKLTAASSGIDKEKIWEDAQANPTTRENDIDRNVSAFIRLQAMAAVKSNKFTDTGQAYCRASLDALRSARDVLAPETRKIRKDF